jgi:pyruvate kinase
MYQQEIQPFGTPFNLSTPQGLLSTLQELRQTVEAEGKVTFDELNPQIKG